MVGKPLVLVDRHAFCLRGNAGRGDVLIDATILDMAGVNNFNHANGWLDGSYHVAEAGLVAQRHQVVIDGNTGDSVASSGWGSSLGTVSNNGHSYAVYNQGLYAQLLIDQAVTAAVL